MEYLGDTREAIGQEKAGIFRAGRPAVCADPDPPRSLLEHARRTGARLIRLGEDFSAVREDSGWHYRGPQWDLPDLPLPVMAGSFQLRNAAAAVAALESLQQRLPVDGSAIRGGLRQARAPGRFQRVAGSPETLLDVAHNPQAARALAATLQENPGWGRTLAVAGMLADKDVEGVVSALVPAVDAWWVCTPDSPRALDAAAFAAVVRRHAGAAPVNALVEPIAAYRAARSAAHDGDRILVFGSFHTVAAILAALKPSRDADTSPEPLPH